MSPLLSHGILHRLPLLLALVFSLLPADRAHAINVHALIEAAMKKGDAQVVIPPGTYRLGHDEENHSFVIHGAKNLIIVAEGVTLVNTILQRTLSLEDCQNVTLRGLTIDYDPLPFTQGTVTKIADDFSSIDVTIDAGYPCRPYERIDVCDPKTRHRKRGMPFLWNTRAAMVDARTVRVTLQDIGKAAQIGDLVSLNTGPDKDQPPHALSVDNCSGMALDHVTVFSAPGFGIVESNGEGGMTYRHCRIVPGPKPPGATAERLLSSSWDAIQTKVTRRGPDVQDCEIQSAGDDSWSVQSSDYVVAALDGPKAVLIFRDSYCNGPQVGDHLARALDSPQPVIATCKGIDLRKANLAPDIRVKLKAHGSYSFWELGWKAIEITTASPFPFAVGYSVYCPDRQCNGFIFRHNYVQSPGRILVKASDGLIEDNEVINCHSGVVVCPEVPGEAASGMANITIRGNHFAGSGYYCPLWSTAQAGCVAITADGIDNQLKRAIVYKNILVEGNRFEDTRGLDISVSSARGVTIRKNIFCDIMTASPSDSGARYGVNQHALIWLDHCEDIHVAGNLVYEPGAFLKDLVGGPGLSADVLQQAIAGVSVRTGEKCPAR